jgi:hypothetical protein
MFAASHVLWLLRQANGIDSSQSNHDDAPLANLRSAFAVPCRRFVPTCAQGRSQLVRRKLFFSQERQVCPILVKDC